jgi:ElaB/YqjD/DUF883 family membrane-anchored ribosome-binding protein
VRQHTDSQHLSTYLVLILNHTDWSHIMSFFRKSPNEALVADMKAVVADAEAILSATADQTGGAIAQLRGSMVGRLSGAKHNLVAFEEALAQKAGQAIKCTDEYVHENPWQSALVVGGVGLLLVYLLSARRR